MTTSKRASNRAPNSPARGRVDRLRDRRGELARLLAVVLIGALLGGCAKEIPPGQAAPSLQSALHRVDAAVAAGDLHKARSEVNTLITDTKQARQRGDISGSQAVQILDAARSVLAHLPSTATQPSASPTPAPSPSPTPTASPSGTKTSTTQDSQKGEGAGDNGQTKPDKKHHGKPDRPDHKKKGGGKGPKKH